MRKLPTCHKSLTNFNFELTTLVAIDTLLIQLRYDHYHDDHYHDDHYHDGPINNIRATYLKYMYYKEALYNFNNLNTIEKLNYIFFYFILLMHTDNPFGFQHYNLHNIHVQTRQIILNSSTPVISFYSAVRERPFNLKCMRGYGFFLKKIF